MNHLTTLALCAALVACTAPPASHASPPAPATQPASTQPTTADVSAAEPASAEAWLQRIEELTGDLDTLRGKITLITVQGLLGDEQRRFGTLVYDAADEQAGEPAQFRLDLDRAVVDNALEERKESYIFDGQWLARRIERDRIFIRQQLAAEGEAGPGLDIGEGPFVLPLNLDRDRVLERFEASVLAAEEGDPANAVHLRLIPREGVDLDEEQIDFWFDRETLLPVRVDTVTSDQTEQTILLRDVERDPELKDTAFDTTPPRESGWEVDVQPLQSAGS